MKNIYENDKNDTENITLEFKLKKMKKILHVFIII